MVLYDKRSKTVYADDRWSIPSPGEEKEKKKEALASIYDHSLETQFTLGVARGCLVTLHSIMPLEFPSRSSLIGLGRSLAVPPLVSSYFKSKEAYLKKEKNHSCSVSVQP